MTHFYSVIAHPEYRDEFLEQYEQSDNEEDREYAAGFRNSCRQALFIVSLWQVWSDGEHGYRSNWLREPKA